MKALLITIICLLCLAALVWIFTTYRRRLQEPAALLNSFEDGHLEAVDRFCGEFEYLLLDNDQQFYAATGGRRGLQRRRRNAARIVQVCQALAATNTLRPEQLQFMFARSSMIAFCSLGALLESVLRWFLPSVPYLCARVAGILYREMSHRMTTLCEESAPDLLFILATRL